ncbi:MAG TPA: alternative ribosome rescue aminoacyl-tRNA hydrolase ArfB [Acidobacteriota bacterium]|nr:alternative ribosome rescue aminoacyl-tRNA hydrolase ArfB [Acidobacteriota bacterium]
MIEINSNLSIPESEISFKASRSGGPGGQNVNKVSTKMTLSFDVEASSSLSDAQRKRIRHRLGNRISKEGLLLIESQEHRSQHANRQAALVRFANLMAAALKKRKPRKKTRISKAAQERRLKEKSRRAEIKKLRQNPNP